MLYYHGPGSAADDCTLKDPETMNCLANSIQDVHSFPPFRSSLAEQEGPSINLLLSEHSYLITAQLW